MKTICLLILSAIFLAACSGQSQQASGTSPKKPVKEYYHSLDRPIDQQWLAKLEADLAAEKFAIDNKTEEQTSIRQFDGTKELFIYGKIRTYNIKRLEAQPANVYPSFMICVFEMKDEAEAEEFLVKWRTAALTTINSVESFARKGRRVFYLTASAQPFRKYMDHFRDKLVMY